MGDLQVFVRSSLEAYIDLIYFETNILHDDVESHSDNYKLVVRCFYRSPLSISNSYLSSVSQAKCQ